MSSLRRHALRTRSHQQPAPRRPAQSLEQLDSQVQHHFHQRHPQFSWLQFQPRRWYNARHCQSSRCLRQLRPCDRRGCGCLLGALSACVLHMIGGGSEGMCLLVGCIPGRGEGPVPNSTPTWGGESRNHGYVRNVKHVLYRNS
jgi:hypothetical protein